MSKVRVERDGALAQIVLESPPLNLFDAELISDLLPDGVLNIVNGLGEEAGAALTQNERIATLPPGVMWRQPTLPTVIPAATTARTGEACTLSAATHDP